MAKNCLKIAKSLSPRTNLRIRFKLQASSVIFNQITPKKKNIKIQKIENINGNRFFFFFKRKQIIPFFH